MAVDIEKEFKKVEIQQPWVVVKHQLTPLRFLNPSLLPLVEEIPPSMSTKRNKRIIRKMLSK